jgi:uncharacterized membrane protein YebE (DUF533 family)
MSSENSTYDVSISIIEKKMRELDSKLNALSLENNELHKRNGKKLNRLMLLVSKNKRKQKGTPAYLIIVIVISVIAIGVIGFLAYKHFKSKSFTGNISSGDTIKAVTDSI